MPKFKEEDFIKELVHCLKATDLVKAKALLQYTPQIGKKAQTRLLYEISKSDSQTAYPLLELLFEMRELEQDIQDKLYELIVANLYDNPAHIIESISNKNLKNKSVYIKLAGDLKVKDAVPILENILINETEKQSLLAAIKASGELKANSSVQILSEFITYDDLEIKQEAINALAEFNDQNAIDILLDAIKDGGTKTDVLVIEAISKIQSQYAFDKLNEMVSSQFTGIRNIVMDSLIKIGPKAVPTLMKSLDSSNTDTVIHTLTTLGQIGDETALPAIQKTLKNSDNANIRFAIYEAMERIPSPKSAIYLANGLNDPEEHVRMAAAKAIDKNLSSVLIGGLKNIVEANDDHSKNIVSALIESGSEKAFGDLLESGTFSELATDYIAQKAHPDTRERFLGILKESGKKDMIERIQQTTASRPEADDGRPVVMVVDDSKMMLKIYKKKLHDMGYRSIEFEFPAEAIKTLKKTKPDLLVTDLNMPTINGLQLSKYARSLYKANELPILMITTQSDFVGRSQSKQQESVSKAEIEKSGANQVLTKPFSDSDLANTISKLLL